MEVRARKTKKDDKDEFGIAIRLFKDIYEVFIQTNDDGDDDDDNFYFEHSVT